MTSVDLSPQPESLTPLAVEVSGLSKTFPGQRALIDVSLDVRPAEIHALLGQNGSGKSTLIKILAGLYTPDPGGAITICGEALPVGSPRDSRRLGLRFVHQALGIIEELTAVENIALGFGYRRRRGRFIDWSSQRAKTLQLLGRLSVRFDIDCPVAELRPVDRTAIAMARALDDDGFVSRVLVLDEPTAALPPAEVDALFSLVREARDAGTSVIYVSHRLDETFALADRTTVLRDGVVRGTARIEDIDRQALVEMIVGNALAEVSPPAEHRSPSSEGSTVALHVHDLVGRGLNGISLSVDKGEVLGVAGLTGSGREELAGALVGQRPCHVVLEDAGGNRCEDPTPRQAKELGVVLVLPNRTPGSAAPEMTVRENLTLPFMPGYSRAGFIRKAKELRDTIRWIDALDIRPRDPDRAYALLSGGNQQKVVFGKWLNLSPDVLVLDDPTSGVDVGARSVIYDLIRSQAAEGMAVILCSSDIDDLLAVCSRVVVLSEGSIVDELRGPEIEEFRIMMSMVGGIQQPGRPDGEPGPGQPLP